MPTLYPNKTKISIIRRHLIGILCILSFAVFSCVKDTSIDGYVVDTENKPIKGVKVLVNSSDIYTLTDEDGFFEIDTNGISDELLFDKQGYQLKFLKMKAIEADEKVHLIKK